MPRSGARLLWLRHAASQGPSGKRARGTVKFEWPKMTYEISVIFNFKKKGRGEEMGRVIGRGFCQEAKVLMSILTQRWCLLLMFLRHVVVISWQVFFCPQSWSFWARPFWSPPTMRKIFQKNGGRRRGMPWPCCVSRIEKLYSYVMLCNVTFSIGLLMITWCHFICQGWLGFSAICALKLPPFQVTSPASGARCIPWKLEKWVTSKHIKSNHHISTDISMTIWHINTYTLDKNTDIKNDMNQNKSDIRSKFHSFFIETPLRPPGVPKTVPKPPSNAAYRLISMLECVAQTRSRKNMKKQHHNRNVGFQDLPEVGLNLNPS